MDISLWQKPILGAPLWSPRCTSILFLTDPAQFVPATELWVSKFFPLYLEKVIKWFSPQALPTGCCYFKLKNKSKSWNKEGDQNYPLVGRKVHSSIVGLIPGCSQAAPQPQQGWVLDSNPGNSLRSPRCEGCLAAPHKCSARSTELQTPAFKS